MTIVDVQHAAQFVSKKGKAQSFDSIECMMNQLKEEDVSQVALFLVNDFNDPGVLNDATQAYYLISKDLPSPMGEFLSAFATKPEAQLAETGHPGEVYSWDELRQRFK
jgi:copper chaperone NosL